MTRPLVYDDLYALSSPSDPQLSPNGRQVAYVLTQADRDTDGYVSALWLVSEGSAPRQLTYGPADSAPR
jgi:dipeptidyl aminopeptidase/acylaminoacyl peptidase